MKRTASSCAFTSSDSWVILSPIEQSIKRKIEAVGVPLKDWGVNIYRGILTGCNEAFIINEAKRAEILTNCKDIAERERTEQLIRPILRGRDIKRYSYEWAHLYIIATFPALHLDIEDYPAVKKYLLSFGKERLEQTGKEYVIDGMHVKSRKRSNNKWFETQDSIGYWDDFSKPKIVWAETMRIHRGNVSDFPRFAMAADEIYTDKTCFIGTGDTKELKVILGILNSKVGRYQLGSLVSKMDDGGWLMQKIYIEKLLIPRLSEIYQQQIISYIDEILNFKKETYVQYNIDSCIYNAYGLANNKFDYAQVVDLVVRFTPDAIIGGEISTTNAGAIWELMNSGHDNCFATIHAESPEAAYQAFISRIMHTNPALDQEKTQKEMRDKLRVVQINRDGNIRAITAIT